MKKNVLFIISALTVGGAENSLVKLLSYIKNDYNINLLLLSREGDFIEKVPKGVNILHIYNPKNEWRKKKLLNIIRIIRNYIHRVATFTLRFSALYYKVLRKIKLRKKYDVEIAYLEPYPFQFISTAPKETKKICSVRNSLKYPERLNSPKWYLKSVEKSFDIADRVFCVSEDATNEFKELYPQDGKKVCTIDNFFNFDEVHNKANEKITYKFDQSKINVVTVGRCGYQKGYIRLLKAHKRLIDDKCNHILHIIGRYVDSVGNYYGDGKEMLEFIKENKLEKSIVLHGEISNPFPLVKNSDIYVSTAFFEGYPRAITEALILRKPIVATNVSGTAYALGYGKYGMLVDNDEDGIYNGLKKMIKGSSEREKYIKKASNFKDRKEEIINEIKKLIEE